MRAKQAQTSPPPRRRRVVVLAVQPDGSPALRAMPRAVLGAVEWGRRHGWEMVDLAQWLMKLPGSLKPDGLISYLGYSNRKRARELHRAIPKGVYIDASFLAGEVPGVEVDWPAIGLRAADYLLARGFRNFAISGYSRTQWPPSLVRFEERVHEAGAHCARIPSLSARGTDLAAKGAFFKERLARLQLPLAIFCLNDRLASRVCRWCLEAGLEIPEQVAILGSDNDFLACECSPVPLSSVGLQCEHRGAEAARLLHRMMKGEAAPAEPVLVPPGEVVTRRSTDIVAIPDLASARALRYLWDHYTENIGVDQVAAACGVSRRSLDRHFGLALGHTVTDELLRLRLARACELLFTTEMPAADVAARAGFHSFQYFNLRFKRAFGLTAQRYRERERTKTR